MARNIEDKDLEMVMKGEASSEEYRTRVKPRLKDYFHSKTTLTEYLSRLKDRIFFESIYGRIIRS
ncbi:MAG TPA: hypothetical protein VJH92_04340 [Candidatus Nanoarchaeia archaeon]|nr:hypothetical protein [Candidatus Nanoarchaeia archaeon]